MRLSSDGVWSLWVDDAQAAAITAAAPEPIALAFTEGEVTVTGRFMGSA